MPQQVVGALDHLIDRGRLTYEQASELLAHYAMNGYGNFPVEEEPPVVEPVDINQLRLF